MGELDAKRERLEEQLSKLPSVIVAYSGGVDSAYLAYAAHQAMGDRMLAVTALSASYSARDRAEAEKCVAHFHFRTSLSRPTNWRIRAIAPTTRTAAITARMNCS